MKIGHFQTDRFDFLMTIICLTNVFLSAANNSSSRNSRHQTNSTMSANLKKKNMGVLHNTSYPHTAAFQHVDQLAFRSQQLPVETVKIKPHSQVYCRRVWLFHRCLTRQKGKSSLCNIVLEQKSDPIFFKLRIKQKPFENLPLILNGQKYFHISHSI